MSDCAKIQELISEMLDGELSERDCAAIEAHIKLCPQCAAMYADFAALSEGVGELWTEVPAGLHDKIMKGVRTAPKPKKSLLITLRPYMSAAACLVVIIGAVFAIRDSRNDTRWLSSTSDTAAPSAAYDMPAAAAADSAEFFSYGKAESAASQEAGEAPDNKYTADIPAEMEMPAGEPAAEAEEVEEAEDNISDCDYPVLDPWEIELRGGAYPPGTEIDWALLTVYDGVETLDIRYLADVAALCEILMAAAPEFDSGAIPRDPTAMLELQCGSKYYMLKLYVLGESLIVETSDGLYLASGTAEEFLSIK